jgi:hypothetical protein
MNRLAIWFVLLLFAALDGRLLLAEKTFSGRVDQLINEKANGPHAAQTSDEDFLRRIYLDFAGRIPASSETLAFLTDRDTAKRQKLVDHLLASPEYARRMTELFHVMLMERLGDHAEWTKYLTDSFQANKPWDQIVKEMIYPNAEDESLRGAAFFLSKRLENYGQNPVDYPGLVRDVGRLFLGVDMQCAQCHDHLFIDDYKQEDYQGLFAFLGQTTLRQDVKFPAVAENLTTKKVAFKSVFVQVEKMTGPRLPRSAEVEIPTFAKGEEYSTAPDKKKKLPGVPKFSPLQILSQQLPRGENDLFKKNIANRLWWVMMGRGLVHPLDLHHSDNPPSHPELLELLANELASREFDMKWLLREIALSETYQRSSELPSGISEVPAESYRVFLEKPLSAEQLVASVVQATGGDGPIASSGDFAPSKEMRERFLKTFANPPREPEGEHAPTLKGALFLMNDQAVLEKFKPVAGNLVDRLTKQADPAKLAEELFLTVLVRRPTSEEVAEIGDYLAAHNGNRDAAIGHLAWSLTASIEFSVNH